MVDRPPEQESYRLQVAGSEKVNSRWSTVNQSEKVTGYKFRVAGSRKSTVDGQQSTNGCRLLVAGKAGVVREIASHRSRAGVTRNDVKRA